MRRDGNGIGYGMDMDMDMDTEIMNAGKFHCQPFPAGAYKNYTQNEMKIYDKRRLKWMRK